MTMFDDFATTQQFAATLDPAGYMRVRPLSFNRRERNHIKFARVDPAVCNVNAVGGLNLFRFLPEGGFKALAQCRTVILDLNKIVSVLLDHDLLHAFLTSMQCIECHDGLVDVLESVEQVVCSGQFLTFAVGELLQKKGAESL